MAIADSPRSGRLTSMIGNRDYYIIEGYFRILIITRGAVTMGAHHIPVVAGSIYQNVEAGLHGVARSRQSDVQLRQMPIRHAVTGRGSASKRFDPIWTAPPLGATEYAPLPYI
jgi:hypothetical protein